MKSRIAVTNRIHLPKEGCEETIRELKEAHTYENPDYVKAKARSKWGVPKKIPKTLQTWEESKSYVSFPRGSYERVLQQLEDDHVDFEVKDEKCMGDPALQQILDSSPLSTNTTLRPFQGDQVEAGLAHPTGLWRAPPGCLTGDTMIGVRRGGTSRQYRLDDLVARFNGASPGAGARWDITSETQVRARLHDGTIGLVPLVAAQNSGVKEIFRLTTRDRKTITATADHRFLTPFGWKKLGELQVGEEVFVEGERKAAKKGVKTKARYKSRKAQLHPYAVNRGEKAGRCVYTHRLVAEAHLNGMTFVQYLERVNQGPIEGLRFVDPETHAVHHLDENPRNNELLNLQILTHARHREVHKELGAKNLRNPAQLVRIESILCAGEAPTYDLSMAGPHNFIANGFVVHNSGKTTASNYYIAQLNKPTVVVVPSAKVFEQWVRRIEAEMGLSYDAIGMLGDGYERIRPVTIAMQQTLQRRADKYSKTFGVYVADEVQRHGSSTFSAVTDTSHAYYRLGVSADERRADGKEFLIYDMFGQVRHTVHREDLIRDGFIHDAEIRVVPTETVLPWYNALPPRKRADGQVQSRLHRELAADPDRNELVRGVLKWCMDAEEQTLLLAWRVEHCHTLNSLAVEMGYRCGLMLGGKDQKEDFEHSRLQMEAGNLQIAAGTYQAIGVGFDLPSLARGVMAAPCANNAKGQYQFGQFTGRFERISFGTGKKGAVIYYLWDRKLFGDRPLKNLMRWRSTVRVLTGNRWVTGKEYLSGKTQAKKDVDDLFA